MLNQEQQCVVKTFKEHFKGDVNRPLVLYGVGRNTEAILDNCTDLNIIGLMDQDSVGEVKFGKKVLSYEEVIELKPTIVIVARDSVVNIIYNRIEFLEEKNISIYKINGTKLYKSGLTYGNEELPYWNIREKDLEKAIDEHTVISFDIFDTLIMRRLVKHDRLSFEDEKKYLVKREVMVNMLQYAVQQGKPVFLLSDMYYSSRELRELLEHCDVTGEYDIIVSCEYEATKETGELFEVLKSKVRNALGKEAEKSILHIGDNRIVDGEMAERAGIGSFLIMSGYELLMASSMQTILVDPGNHRWNQTVGFFISTYLNNPFVLHGKKGLVKVDTLEELGYFFIAPIMYEYMLWLKNKVLQGRIAKMLFASRDGGLPYLIYEKMKERWTTLPKAVYFKTSRRAVTVAAINNQKDIRRLAERAFSGNIKAFFKERFGVQATEEAKWENTEEQKKKLLEKYETPILRNSEEERGSYLNYLDKLGINRSMQQGFFDFVASGTVQYYMEKLIQQELRGYYFATMNLPNDFYKEGVIDAPFGNITSYGSDSNLSKHYLAMESILTDSDNTLVKTKKGEPIFAEGENEKYEQMQQIHGGVLRYVEERLDLEYLYGMEGESDVDFTGADSLLGYIFEGKEVISDEMKSVFVNDDNYDGKQNYKVF
jgi:predicted HAD superfamily hydrolase